jgi:hypothetical protein
VPSANLEIMRHRPDALIEAFGTRRGFAAVVVSSGGLVLSLPWGDAEVVDRPVDLHAGEHGQG